MTGTRAVVLVADDEGTDLCFHVLAERPGIRVLMMSGDPRREAGLPKLAVPFLPKPFDGQTLRARVNALLTSPPAGGPS